MRKIAFLLGGVEISGGINVIFQHAMHLANKGYEVSFITNKVILSMDVSWHSIHEYLKGDGKARITWYSFNDLNRLSFDIAIATWWRSYFNLWRVNAQYYLYFVQSIESRFYPSNEISLRSVVESSYELDLGYITECKWISQYLYDNYNHKVPVALNGIDKGIFNQQQDIAIAPREKDCLRVLIEGPIDVPFKNVPNTINIVNRSLADEAWLLTSSALDEVNGIDKLFSKIPMQHTPTVYRSCDVIIKLSYVEGMFGPPLEMFHCGGTCIVYDVTGHDEYVVHGKNGIIVKTDDAEEAISYINELKHNTDVLEKLKKGAAKTAMEWPDWKKSNDMFEDAIFEAVNHSKISHELLKRFSKRVWHIYEYRNC